MEKNIPNKYSYLHHYELNHKNYRYWKAKKFSISTIKNAEPPTSKLNPNDMKILSKAWNYQADVLRFESIKDVYKCNKFINKNLDINLGITNNITTQGFLFIVNLIKKLQKSTTYVKITGNVKIETRDRYIKILLKVLSSLRGLESLFLDFKLRNVRNYKQFIPEPQHFSYYKRCLSQNLINLEYLNLFNHFLDLEKKYFFIEYGKLLSSIPNLKSLALPRDYCPYRILDHYFYVLQGFGYENLSKVKLSLNIFDLMRRQKVSTDILYKIDNILKKCNQKSLHYSISNQYTIQSRLMESLQFLQSPSDELSLRIMTEFDGKDQKYQTIPGTHPTKYRPQDINPYTKEFKEIEKELKLQVSSLKTPLKKLSVDFYTYINKMNQPLDPQALIFIIKNINAKEAQFSFDLCATDHKEGQGVFAYLLDNDSYEKLTVQMYKTSMNLGKMLKKSIKPNKNLRELNLLWSIMCSQYSAANPEYMPAKLNNLFDAIPDSFPSLKKFYMTYQAHKSLRAIVVSALKLDKFIDFAQQFEQFFMDFSTFALFEVKDYYKILYLLKCNLLTQNTQLKFVMTKEDCLKHKINKKNSTEFKGMLQTKHNVEFNTVQICHWNSKSITKIQDEIIKEYE